MLKAVAVVAVNTPETNIQAMPARAMVIASIRTVAIMLEMPFRIFNI
jgi:hypothetical protein